MKVIKQHPYGIIALAVILLVTACSGQGEIALETEQRTVQQADEITQDTELETRQRADETVLVDLGRTYNHSVPAGLYMEYALNNAGDQALTVTLTPAGDQNLALTIVRADNPAVTVMNMDEFAAGEAKMVRFNPEAGVNYLLRVYGISGNYVAYELTIAP